MTVGLKTIHDRAGPTYHDRRLKDRLPYQSLIRTLPEHLSYGLWGLIAGSILADAEYCLLRISDDTKEIKEQMVDLRGRLERVESRLRAVDPRK